MGRFAQRREHSAIFQACDTQDANVCRRCLGSATERRGENRHYYYKSVRHGDKVRKVYYGKGPAAEVAAQAAELKRAVRARRTEALRRLRASYEDAAEMVDRLNREMDCIANLLSAGPVRNIWAVSGGLDFVDPRLERGCDLLVSEEGGFRALTCRGGSGTALLLPSVTLHGDSQQFKDLLLQGRQFRHHHFRFPARLLELVTLNTIE